MYTVMTPDHESRLLGDVIGFILIFQCEMNLVSPHRFHFGSLPIPCPAPILETVTP